jgi:hypothetical protein
MENAASVEIRKKHGFPLPLGKVVLQSCPTFPHFPQALPIVLFFRSLKALDTPGITEE